MNRRNLEEETDKEELDYLCSNLGSLIKRKAAACEEPKRVVKRRTIERSTEIIEDDEQSIIERVKDYLQKLLPKSQFAKVMELSVRVMVIGKVRVGWPCSRWQAYRYSVSFGSSAAISSK